MNTQTQLPYEAERLLNAELSGDETLLWSGQPRPGRFLAPSIGLAIFGIPWTAFSVFWVVMASGITSGFGRAAAHLNGSPAPFSLFAMFFPLFGLPFVGIGLWMLSSPYWARRKALKTVYALTSRRALILESNWRGAVTVRSIPSAHLADRTRTHDRNGSGDLIFTRLATVSSGLHGETSTQTVGFQGIPDVRGVDDLIGRTFG